MRAVSRILGEVRGELLKTPSCMFASDNTGGAHPEVMDAVREVNDLPAVAPYGECLVTQTAVAVMRKELALGDDTHIRFVTSGTAGNVLGLSLACSRPYHAVVTSKCAHIQTNTVGACENVFGAKMHSLQSEKVLVEELRPLLEHCSVSPEYYTIPKVVSITLSTEYGDVYSMEEMAGIKALCKEYNVLLHVDGARIGNACVALGEAMGITAEEVMRQVVDLADVMTLGGAKNGLFNAEAVVVKSHVCPAAVEVKAASKQQSLIISKARYASVQYLAYFTESLWVRNARNANNMAMLMYNLLKDKPTVQHVDPPVTNQLFVSVSKEQLEVIQKRYMVYPWGTRDGATVIRLVTSWDTDEEGCRGFADLF
eukprot:TRINITY_DN16356_c0_g1_i1.p2 TRINITY_DN16356_c0_g1~~TRINITY_DN16356_c0_g1_i1.p2  ORF type:complete len:369 (+),score=139.37 TRINITY_DN16356_c0_g1_i1:40-1146(+)